MRTRTFSPLVRQLFFSKYVGQGRTQEISILLLFPFKTFWKVYLLRNKRETQGEGKLDESKLQNKLFFSLSLHSTLPFTPAPIFYQVHLMTPLKLRNSIVINQRWGGAKSTSNFFRKRNVSVQQKVNIHHSPHPSKHTQASCSFKRFSVAPNVPRLLFFFHRKV